MQRFKITTLVDITETGVIRNTREQEFTRNQQRNWECMIQVIGLRAQPLLLTSPLESKKTFGHYGIQRVWEFEFSVEHTGVFGDSRSSTVYLESDFDGVPFIVGLRETVDFPLAAFVSAGSHQNIIITQQD